MKTLILAAGEGSRTQEITRDIPKSIFSLNRKNETTLSILLKNLVDHGFNEIILVGGYKIEKLREEIPKIQPKGCKIELIDASQDYKKGPIYSFLTAYEQMINEKQFLLVPGDSVFSSSFFKFIQNSNITEDVCRLFYYKSDKYPLSGSQCLLTNFTEQIGKVKKIIKLKKWKENYLRKHKFYPILIPMTILPGKFFKYAKEQSEKGVKNVISALSSFCTSENNCKSYQFYTNKWVFHDFDIPNDISKIQELIKNE